MKQLKILFHLLVFLPSLYSQTGPAGIGNIQGTNNHPAAVLWLMADSIPELVDNADISAWNDISGRSNDLFTSANGNEPAIRINYVNGHKAVNFEDANDERILVYPFNDMPTQQFSIFIVNATSDNVASFLSYDAAGNGNELLLFENNTFNVYIDGTQSNTATNLHSGAWQIVSTHWTNAGGYLGVYHNSTSIYSTTVKNGTSLVSGGGLALGGEQDGVDIYGQSEQDFNGDIAEVIMYDALLNSAQRTIVENYLSERYSISIANDYFTGNDASFMHQLSGIGVEADGNWTSGFSGGFQLSEVSGLDANGEYVLAAHDNTSHAVSVADLPLGVEARWARSWYLNKTGTVNTRLAFDFSEAFGAGKYPQELSNYVLLYRNLLTDTYSQAGVADGITGDQIYFDVTNAALSNGYYTLGTKDQTASPVEGGAGQIWYTLLSGANWTNWETWTLDPSGNLPENPGHNIPSNSDKVVILSGKTILVDTNGLNTAELEVNGYLDLDTTSGHNFTTITGNGTIKLQTDNFPDGDAGFFTTQYLGEGTVEYYGANYTIERNLSFYNLVINLSNTSDELTLTNNLQVNGNLTVRKGIFKINNSSTQDLTIDITGDLQIEPNGKIATGAGDARHQMNLYGDLLVDGPVEFTSNLANDYNTLNPAYGITDVNFLNGSSDQRIDINASASFYRIEIDKGIDKTYVLHIDATDASYFHLYGYARENHPSTAQMSNNANALGLITGTVRIGNNITINPLNNTGNCNINQDAALWVDGGTVIQPTGNATVPYGEIRVSAGSFLTGSGVSSGITTRGNGLINISGGTITTNQIRTSVLGASNVGGYVQSGGTTHILGSNTNADYYAFTLTYPGNVFNMSGGTLHIHEANGRGGLFIASDESNVNVTGGTVIMEIDDGNPFPVTSKAPFYNLILRNTSGGNDSHILSEGIDVGATNEYLAAQPLVVLNDLTIEEDAFLDHDGNDVTIGRNFYISENAQQVGTNNYGYLYDGSALNNTTFNGNRDATIYIGHSIADGYELQFGNVTIDKPVGTSLTLTGDTEKTAQYLEDNGNPPHFARLIRIDGTLDLESGTLNQGEHSIRLFGPINLTKDATCGEYIAGTTHHDALIMFKDSNIDITTENGATMGNIKMNPDPDTDIITLTSDLYIKRIAYHHGRINMGSHNLKVDYLHRNSTLNDYNFNNGNAATEMFYSDGNHSDGGLSLYIPAGTADNTSIAFPVGVLGKYTNVEFRLENVTDDGYITVTVSDNELATTDLAGGDILSYYWRVNYSDFTSLPDVNRIRMVYDESDLDGSANETSFVPGKVTDGLPFTRSYENDVNQIDHTTNTITFNGNGTPFTLEKVNYTAGMPARFTGDVRIFYSRDLRREPLWNEAGAWTRSDLLNPDINSDGVSNYLDFHDSRQPASPDFPGVGDVAVIGWVPWTDPNRAGILGQPHCIWIENTNYTVAELIFTDMKDVAGNPTSRVYRSNFQFRPTLCINNTNGQLTADLVRGEGMFWNRASDPDYTLMDIGLFAAEDSAYVVYENFAANRTLLNTAPEFPNLMIANNGWGQNNHNITFSKDIITTGNFEILGDANLLLSNGLTGDITIGRDLLMFESSAIGASGGGAEIAFQNNGAARAITIYGNLLNESTDNGSNDGNGGLIHVRAPNTTIIDHTINLYGNVQQNSSAAGASGLQLFSASNEDRVTLNLLGTESANWIISSGDIPNLYRLVIDKGSNQSVNVEISTDFILNGPTNGAQKALELKAGTLILDNPNININLTTGGENFLIPSSAAIELRQGQINAKGNSGILLDGRLQIKGGTVDMIGGDNYIEYSASGSAALEINGGTLMVGSQIRRGTTSTEGILNYTQTGGVVIAGYTTAPEVNRGVFEVMNEQSQFNFTGGDLYIARSQSSPVVASLILDPEYSNTSSDAKIHLGYTNTPNNELINVYSNISIPYLVVDNSSGHSIQAGISTIPLTIGDTLLIQSQTTFNTNGLDLHIDGDFVNQGAFNHQYNTTYFGSSNTQFITGATSFYNIQKTDGNVLTINSPVTVENDLSLSGTISDNGLTLYVKGDVDNNGNISHDNGGNGIELNGSSRQVLTGNGKYGKLTVNNNAGALVYNTDTLYIDEVLNLERGVLDIDRFLLYIDEDAVIEEGNPFSENNMIQTNISFTDNGVIKVFPSSPQIFTYPIGSQGKYSPVIMDIQAMGTSGGYIRVRAANETHPTLKYFDDPETGCQFDDSLNVLDYHWILEGSGVSGFSAHVDFKFSASDIALDNACGYDAANYIPAQLLMNNRAWQKYDAADFNTGTNMMRFRFNNNDDNQISADYTAGLEISPGISAIPDSVAEYETVMDGDWTNSAVWDPTVSGGPRGAAVTIYDSVLMDRNYIPVYTTTIAASGVLNAATTYGHRLGVVDGQGKLYVESGNLPAGYYADFFSAAGGTLEYGGTPGSGYNVLGAVSVLNNLILSGTQERVMPNHNVTLYGNFTIDGDDNTMLVNNASNRSLTLYGNMIKTGGIFDAGSGTNAMLIFTGTNTQLLQGDFTGSSMLNSLKIDNNRGLLLGGNVTVDDELYLTDGVIATGLGSMLALTRNATVTPSGGSSGSFVDGPMQKQIDNTSSFTFPIGDDGRLGQLSLGSTSTTGSVYWETEYIFDAPLLAGMNPFSTSININTVSQTEYWRIKAPVSGNQAKITLRWDSQSDLPGASALGDLRIVYWNTSLSRWEEISGVTYSGNVNSGTLTTTSAFAFDGTDQFFTLASVDVLTAYAQFIDGDAAVCAGNSVNIRVALTGSPNWTLTYSIDGVDQSPVTGITSSPYIITASSDASYSLVSVSDIYGVGTVDATPVNITIHPEIFVEAGMDTAICNGDAITLGGSPTAGGGGGSFSYAWTPATDITALNVANPVANPSASIKYFVTVTDANYCTETDSINVTVNALPVAGLTASDDTIVFDCNPVQFNSTPGMANYSWTPADSLTDATIPNPEYIPFSNPQSIHYTFTVDVTVTDANGCSDNESIDITVYRKPETGPIYKSQDF